MALYSPKRILIYMEKITFRPCIVALLVLAVCISCTGVVCADVAPPSGYITHVVHGSQDFGPTAQSTTGTETMSYLFIPTIQNYKNIRLIVINTAGTLSTGQSTCTLTSGGTTVGTGEILVFKASPTITTIHIVIDYFNNAHGLSGNVVLTMTTPTYTPSYTGGKGGTTTAPSLQSTSSPASTKMTNLGSILCYSTTYSNYYEFVDMGDVGTITVARLPYTVGDTVESTVNITQDGSLVVNEYKASGNTSAAVYANPANLCVSFAPATYCLDFLISNQSYVPITPTATPTPTPTIPGCGIDVSLALTKYTSIFPYEYINGTIAITGDTPLNSGSSIRWMTGPGPGSTATKETLAVYSNVSGTWYVTKNDLGVVSGPIPTTYEDALTESVRFPDAGNYVVRVSVTTDGGCNTYDEKPLQVFPTSGVNVDFYFRDCLNGNLLGDAVATIENVGVTGDVLYTGNPIGVAAQIGANLSVNASSPGYTFSAFNYIVPGVSGTTLDVPVYLCPEEISDIHPGNTSLIVNVRSYSTTEPIHGAYVTASAAGTTIDTGYSNSMGYTMLQIPFRAGDTKVDVTAFPYHSQSKYLALNNATSYEETFWLMYSGTPTPTPTVTYDPNATYTPTVTATDTPAPTTTVVTKPKLVVEVADSRYGYTVPISGASVKLYSGSTTDMVYKGSLIQTAITATNGRTNAMQMNANEAYWCDVSASGYYSSSERFRMASQDSTRFVQLIPVGENVTVVTTTTTPGGNIYPDIGDGEATGWVAMFIEWVMENFGVNEWAARTILGLFATLMCAVFVGGCLAGFGSGEGAAMGALIGGCFGWIFACLVGFIPMWLLIVSIAFVGMAFFVWHHAGGAGGG